MYIFIYDRAIHVSEDVTSLLFFLFTFSHIYIFFVFMHADFSEHVSQRVKMYLTGSQTNCRHQRMMYVLLECKLRH